MLVWSWTGEKWQVVQPYEVCKVIDGAPMQELGAVVRKCQAITIAGVELTWKVELTLCVVG